MTKLIKSIEDLKNELTNASKPVAFVPTMGSLHNGHISLINKAKKENKTVVLSVYVNPLQFGPSEDFKSYPRNLNSDHEKCVSSGVDILFAPEDREIYPEDSFENIQLIQPPAVLTSILCGKTRVNHFAGVVTVLKRLFDIVEPQSVYLGEKDLQQVYVVNWLIKSYNLQIKINPCPIIREEDGLAMSSRNLYLTEGERKIASNIYKSLKIARENVKIGIFTPSKAVLEGLIFLSKIPGIKVEYFEARSKDDLNEVNKDTMKDFYFLIAAKIGNVRLIDNVEVS